MLRHKGLWTLLLLLPILSSCESLGTLIGAINVIIESGSATTERVKGEWLGPAGEIIVVTGDVNGLTFSRTRNGGNASESEQGDPGVNNVVYRGALRVKGILTEDGKRLNWDGESPWFRPPEDLEGIQRNVSFTMAPYKYEYISDDVGELPGACREICLADTECGAFSFKYPGVETTASSCQLYPLDSGTAPIIKPQTGAYSGVLENRLIATEFARLLKNTYVDVTLNWVKVVDTTEGGSDQVWVEVEADDAHYTFPPKRKINCQTQNCGYSQPYHHMNEDSDSELWGLVQHWKAKDRLTISIREADDYSSDDLIFRQEFSPYMEPGTWTWSTPKNGTEGGHSYDGQYEVSYTVRTAPLPRLPKGPFHGSVASVEAKDTASSGKDEVYFRYRVDDGAWEETATRSMNEKSEIQSWKPDETWTFSKQVELEIWDRDSDQIIGRELLSAFNPGVYARTYRENGKYRVRYKIRPDAEAESQYPTLILKSIKCIKPAIGTEPEFGPSMTSNVGKAISSNYGLLADPDSQAVVAVGSAFLIGALATLITEADKNNPDPDQVIIRVNGEKVWPTDKKYKDMKAGQIENPNIRIENWDISQQIVVYDYDAGSNDDPLFTLSRQGGLNPGRGESEFGFGLYDKKDMAAYEFQFELITGP